MNKRVLIISPYFPPVNTADTQRVRMSLPYFAGYGWDAEVVMVDEQYADMPTDSLLMQSVPSYINIHKVKAFDKKWTAKLGLGSIALRSLWFYKQKINQLLKAGKYDLIYFSTTQFPVCILGAYWKKKFRIPYIIDMQDPWHSDYYQDKPKHQRPPKYWFSYRLNKYLEPIAIKNAGGLISVSTAYIDDLKARYPEIKNTPAVTITFGAFEPDIKIAEENHRCFPNLLNPQTTNIVYIGRGGADMHQSITTLFKTFQEALKHDQQTFGNLRFYFIGTSYAPAGKGKATIKPLAERYNIEHQVIEITDRISYYHTLTTLARADALFIPGSDDSRYTASKIYPYLLTRKPVLAIFNEASPAVAVLKEYGVTDVYNYSQVSQQSLTNFLKKAVNGSLKTKPYNPGAIEKYSAKQLTLQQCLFFNRVINEQGLIK